MNQTQLTNHIVQWTERARHETDPFVKFSNLWPAFNAALRVFSGKKTDRAMINWLKTKTGGSDSMIEAYDLAFEGDPFQWGLERLVKLSPIVDPRPNGRSISVGSVNDFDDVVEAIYLVRCNFLHGSKSPIDSRDRELTQVTGNLLEKWLNHLIRILRG